MSRADHDGWTPPVERSLVGVKTHGVVCGAGFRAHFILGRNGKILRLTEADAVAHADELNKRHGCGYHASSLGSKLQETGNTG